jgi:hypothetical protein
MCQRGHRAPLFGAALFPGSDINYCGTARIPDAGSPAAGNTVRA